MMAKRDSVIHFGRTSFLTQPKLAPQKPIKSLVEPLPSWSEYEPFEKRAFEQPKSLSDKFLADEFLRLGKIIDTAPWKTKILSGIHVIRHYVICGASETAKFKPLFVLHLREPIARQLSDPDYRSAVVCELCALMEEIIIRTKTSFKAIAEYFVPILFKPLTQPIGVTSETADKCICSMLHHARVTKPIARMVEAVRTMRRKKLARFCAKYLCIVASEYATQRLVKFEKSISAVIPNLLRDEKTKGEATMLYSIVEKRFPATARSVCSDLTKAEKEYLDANKEFVDLGAVERSVSIEDVGLRELEEEASRALREQFPRERRLPGKPGEMHAQVVDDHISETEARLRAACAALRLEEITRLYEEEGVDFSFKDKHDATVMHYIARSTALTDKQRKRQLECAEYILKHWWSANVNATRSASVQGEQERFNEQMSADIFGTTPLHDAVDKENMFMAQLFILYGASVEKVNDKGQTPLDLAKKSRDRKHLLGWVEEYQKKREAEERRRDNAIMEEEFAAIQRRIEARRVTAAEKKISATKLAARKKEEERIASSGLVLSPKVTRTSGDRTHVPSSILVSRSSREDGPSSARSSQSRRGSAKSDAGSPRTSPRNGTAKEAASPAVRRGSAKTSPHSEGRPVQRRRSTNKR